MTDGLVAGAFALLTLLSLASHLVPIPDLDLPPPWLLILLGAIGTAVVLLRRRLPWQAFAAAVALMLVSFPIDSPLQPAALLITVYALGAYQSSRAAWLGFAIGSAAGMVDALLKTFSDGWRDESIDAGGDLALWFNIAVPFTVLLLVSTLLGNNVGGRARYVAAILDRAAQLGRERDQQAEIASARERERIAREMHDVIAHSLSVMIALAEGAAATPDQARSRDAIAAVAETGRRTLAEVRRLLARVRSDDEGPADARAPQPRAEDLPELVGEFGRAGLPVRLRVSGDPRPDAALGLTVYRIVQESLTNALRHARGVTRVDVRVEWRDDAVSILVEDDGLAVAVSEGGRGLLGMRERAALYGGTAEIGPREPRGWRVSVLLREGEAS
ncbi:sensor histidine kinase [Microbacterium paludicola]|uniref:sensor histidine kinase n=1 Tax=Microbacterium paludicola TaxID=300019 RepID=UPI00387A6CEA